MAKLSEHYQLQQEAGGPQDGPGSTWSSARDGVAGLLAKRRDALGWKLTDIAESLRIRVEYLTALEAGSLEGLPGPAYAMGFLRAYADYLGFDGKDIVRRFKAEQTSLSAKPELTFPMPLTERGIPGSGLLLTALILVGLGYGTWYYLSSDKGDALPQVEAVPAQLAPKPPAAPKPAAVAATPAPAVQAPPLALTPQPMPTPAASTSPTTPTTPPAITASPNAVTPVQPVIIQAAPQPSAPQPVQAAAPTVPAESPAPRPAPPVVVPPPAPPAPIAATSKIEIVASAITWFQLSENNKPIVTKMLQPGESFPVPDRPGLSLWTGNAGGMHLVVNGTSLPPPGRLGEAKRHIKLDPDSLLSAPRH